MRNLLSLAALVIVAAAVAGYYLDWYHIRTTRSGAPGHETVNVDINGVKILKDVQKGVNKGEEKLQHVLEKTTQEQTASQPAQNMPAGPSTDLPSQ